MLAFYKIGNQYLNVSQILTVRWFSISKICDVPTYRLEIVSVMGGTLYVEDVKTDPQRRAAEILTEIAQVVRGDGTLPEKS